MRGIPKELREKMAENPFMRTCCIPGCGRGWPSWHHCWIYAGKQINEEWAIMPVCTMHHQYGKSAVHKCRMTKELVEYMSLKRATPEDLKKYPKRDWKQKFNYLHNKYGQVVNGTDGR